MRVADLRKFGGVVVADITLLESALCKLKQWIVVKIVIGGGSLEVLGFKNHRQKICFWTCHLLSTNTSRLLGTSFQVRVFIMQ